MTTVHAKIQGLIEPHQLGVFINNEWHPSISGKTFDVIDPATEEVLAHSALGEAEDINAAVKAAMSALKPDSPWKRMDGAGRRDLLLRLANLWEKEVDSLAKLEAINNGTLLPFQTFVVKALIGDIRYNAGWADKMEGSVVESSPGTHTYVTHEEIGVCGLILPWNVPLWALMVKLAPCLAMGNTVVVKPAEQTPLTALRVAQLFVDAGFPPGVISIVPGFGGGDKGAGTTLSHHMDVRKIAFTGSTEVGRLVMKAAANSNLKRVQLELGGKSPLVVFEDADLDKATAIASVAVFTNNGQLCTCGSRTFVHESVYDAFVEKALATAKKLKLGDPIAEEQVDVGPVIDKDQYEKVLQYIELGKQEGAQVILGGESSLHNKGYFVQPTVFAGVEDSMTIAKEEIFGPVQSIIRFKDVEEVIERCNATEYGLAAGIITNDISKVFQLTKRLNAGTVWVNTYHEIYGTAEFGGFKQSGFGREGGNPMTEWSISKSVVIRYAAAL